MYARHESARVRPNAGGYLVLVLVAAVVVTACVTTSCTNLAASPTTAPAPVPSTTTAAPPMTPTAVVGPSSTGTPHSGGAFPMPPPGTCHLGSVAGQPMPDEHCSPGATNAAVTQGTIHQTICTSGWTATVRPLVAITDAIKAQSAHAYGIPAGTTGELDHKMALELGGDPATPETWLIFGSNQARSPTSKTPSNGSSTTPRVRLDHPRDRADRHQPLLAHRRHRRWPPARRCSSETR